MTISFGDREIDLDRIEIRRAGEIVDVQPQVFDVIEYLVRHRDRMVPKEELLDNVWGDRFVSESALTSRIKSARRALGDDGATQGVIRTIHGRGYRFVAELDGDDPHLATAEATPGVPAPPSEAEGAVIVGRATIVHEIVELLDRRDGALGALIRGADRSGKSTVVSEVVRRERDAGRQVDEVRGTARSIALSAVAHLLPADVVGVGDAGGLPDDVARSAWWQRARAALADRFDVEPRPLVAVDDAELVDAMSASVLAHLAQHGEVRLLVTGRSGGDEFEHLADVGTLAVVDLRPLDEPDVDALLFRRLGGTIDLDSLRQTVEVSGGLPGIVLDVIETSIQAGTLREHDGVWRFVGRPATTLARDWPPEGISVEARHAAELLALVDEVPLEVAAAMVGDEQLDELDAAGLIGLGHPVDETVTVRLADPLLADVVATATPPLRSRRHRRTIGDRALHPPIVPTLLASVVSWPDERDRIDAASRIDGALGALRTGDYRSAGRLIDGLDTRRHPECAVIAAELAARDGRHADAESLLREIDVDALVRDELVTTAVRRRSSIELLVHGRRDASIELLDASDAHDDVVRESLTARLATVFAAVHRYDDVRRLVATEELTDPVVRAEAEAASAMAAAGVGRFHESMERCDRVESLVGSAPAMLAEELADTVALLRCTALQQVGDLGEASDFHRRRLAGDRIVRFGFAPAAAADIELHAGRPRAARELIRGAVALRMRNTHPQYAALVHVVSARIAVALGDADLAVRELDAWREETDRTHGAARARSLTWALLARDDLGLDLSDLDIEGLIRRSVELGARLSECEARCAAVLVDPTPGAARRHLERLDELVDGFDGRLWPLRLEHVRVRAGGGDLDEIAAEYRRLGYVELAGRAAAGR